MTRTFQSLISDQTGATAIEYALIAGGIAVVIIAGTTLLGADLQAFFVTLADAI